MNDKLVVFVTLIAKPESVAELRRCVDNLVKNSREEEGCLNYDFFMDIADPNVFMLHETWASEVHHSAHMQTLHFVEGAKTFKTLTQSLVVRRTKMI